MATKKTSKSKASATDGGAEVDAFLRKAKHPLTPVIEALRRAILDVDPSIGEGVKWNSASFRTDDWFATADARVGPFVRVVFHRGAKKKDDALKTRIGDPEGLLEWHSPDRASAKFRDVAEVAARREALQAIVREWIRRM